jgi:hypothetical protein
MKRGQEDAVVEQALKRVRARAECAGPRAPGPSEHYERGYRRGAEDAQALIMAVVAEELQEVQRQTRALVLAEAQEDLRARGRAAWDERARPSFVWRGF